MQRPSAVQGSNGQQIVTPLDQPANCHTREHPGQAEQQKTGRRAGKNADQFPSGAHGKHLHPGTPPGHFSAGYLPAQQPDRQIMPQLVNQCRQESGENPPDRNNQKQCSRKNIKAVVNTDPSQHFRKPRGGKPVPPL